MTFSVALVGADGAGKTTVARKAAAMLPFPARSLYMGVNLESSSVMLPTTRLLLMVKRARGRRPDMVLSRSETGQRPSRRTSGSRLKEIARLAVWLSEEAFRSIVAARSHRRGEVVIFDRHFFADYYAYDVEPGTPRSLASRVHGFFLSRILAQPDLVLCLDAPAEVLYERKPEASREWLDARRHEYLRLSDVVPNFAVVDASRPLDDVVGDVTAAICTYAEGRHGTLARSPSTSDSARKESANGAS